MSFSAIHQFSPSCSLGDGVSQSLFLTQALLRELGYESEIYAEHIPDELKDKVHYFRDLPSDSDSLLFVHHCTGYDNPEWLWDLDQIKVLVYHNITPENFWPVGDLNRRLSRLGREQLALWTDKFVGAIGVSKINCEELQQLKYSNVVELPILLDWQDWLKAPVDESVAQQFQGTFNLLFVGRITYNKRQDKLINIFAEYLHYTKEPARLILAGGISSEAYYQELLKQIDHLGLSGLVEITGKIEQPALTALYRGAHVFVCMSEHEGFGMPLIEAMANGLPIVAARCSGVPDTVSEGGFLVDPETAFSEVAGLIHLIRQEPEVRARLRTQQRIRLARMTRAQMKENLANWLKSLGYHTKTISYLDIERAEPGWQIEGPLFGSYSLAVVNRELIKALDSNGCAVSVRLMDGVGNLKSSVKDWQMYPILERLPRSPQIDRIPLVSLRFTYPPRTDGLLGNRRWIHSYGWEESSFPLAYTQAFNRDLDGVTVLSQFVRKTLIDSGVVLPIEVVGAGMDQLPETSGKLPISWYVSVSKEDKIFLHISSCFPRKGIEELLEAWGQAFNSHDNVILVIKTLPNEHNKVRDILMRERSKQFKYPRVLIIEDALNDADMVALYQASDVFVLPSRGEGLGLPAAEAMRYGLPVITTAWSGQLDFCTDETAYLCRYHFAYTDSHVGTEHSVWAIPDISHLVELMRMCLEFTDKHPKQSAAYQKVSELTWLNSVKAHQAFEKKCSLQNLIRPKPHIALISTWNVRCGIAEYARHQIGSWPSSRVSIMADYDGMNVELDQNSRDYSVVRNWRKNSTNAWQAVLDDCVAKNVNAALVQYNYGFYSLQELAILCDGLRSRGIQTHVIFHATSDTQRPEGLQQLKSVADSLKQVSRLYVHGVDDLNRLHAIDLVDNVTLIPHGVPIFLPTISVASDLKKKPFILASYGFALPHKGLQQLVRAFAKLRSSRPLELRLINAEFPAEESVREIKAIKQLIIELQLEDRIYLVTEFLSDESAQVWLKDADFIIFPYQNTQESASGAIRLALGLGVPVVTTPLNIFADVADVTYTLSGVGLEDLVDGLQQLIDKPDLLMKKTVRQEAWVAARAWPVMSQRFLQIIDSLALNKTFDQILCNEDIA